MEIESIIAITGALGFLIGIFFGLFMAMGNRNNNMQKTIRYYRELKDVDKVIYENLLKEIYDKNGLLFRFTPTRPFRYLQNWINELLYKIEQKYIDE